jgi:predicted metal-binding membrane protein
VLAGLFLVVVLGLTATVKSGDMLMSWRDTHTPAYAFMLFIMWWTMMLAMMLPSAAPAILTFGTLSRRFSEKGVAAAPISVFTAGYLAIWAGFSAAATALQLLTQDLVPLTGMMAVTSSVVGGALLLAAGLYQFSPLKSACLRKCQSPLMFFAQNWRKGYAGALRMGFEHGVYCLGCCWVLMGLLFYGGVMELTWIIGLAVFVAAEKLLPAGPWLSRGSALVLIGWGLWILAGAVSSAA